MWRFNDPWPMIYSSVVDYYLEPKIAYYFVRRAYEPVLVSFDRTPDWIPVWVTNDSPEPVSGKLEVQHLRFIGKQMGGGRIEQTVPVGFSSYAGMDIGRDNRGVVVFAYEDKAPYAFTGTVKKVVFHLKPAHIESETDLHEHNMIQAVAGGVAA